jgi:hypothetical protein
MKSHVYFSLISSATFTWRQWFPDGDVPSPRVGHSASVVGSDSSLSSLFRFLFHWLIWLLVDRNQNLLLGRPFWDWGRFRFTKIQWFVCFQYEKNEIHSSQTKWEDPISAFLALRRGLCFFLFLSSLSFSFSFLFSFSLCGKHINSNRIDVSISQIINEKIYIFGGTGDNQIYNDIYALNLSTWLRFAFKLN